MTLLRLWSAFVVGFWLGVAQAQMPAIVPSAPHIPASPADAEHAGTNRTSRRRRAKLERVA